ncbi:hypothetical protein DFR50_1025 [Roseiarcus fermentans]|uniref:Patatin-like phospholipase n=1 Tax=Roseiarcus fermentans TaxID=1473586 RepID=A0A366FS49_9HYPH|nr:hypothetical protein [Roseiarcus fermentans]RBP17514.1 hypothetical protein DFR50_1025 [Roseiarcus fermentans]
MRDRAQALSQARDFLQALGVMWRPIALLGAAGYLLFFNDQGRELGVSLMGERYGWPLVFLFFALMYWAANTWHTARLGIAAALESGALGVPPAQATPGSPTRRVVSGGERWLYWPPRLLGVFAHLFAAINLTLAAWNVPDAAWGEPALRWLSLSAPLAILLATAFVWAEDVKRSPRSRSSAAPDKVKFASWVARVSIVGEVALLGALAILSLLRDHFPQGFVPATIVISMSAIAFLALISWLRSRRPPLGGQATAAAREADDRRQRSEIAAFTLGLFGLAVLFAIFVWISPTGVGHRLGSLVVAYFAFGAILSLVNFVEFAIDRAVQREVFGQNASRRVLGAYVLAFVVILGLANAWLRPFHRVRACEGDCTPVALPNDRPKVADAAEAWYAKAQSAYDKAHGVGPVPMLVVATAGGGIRAAYWTATVLEQLDAKFAAQGGIRPYLFAISGVSGGSVGAAAFSAALTKREENHCSAPIAGDPACPPATDYLKADFLAPPLASLVFVDALSSFLPDLGQGDRGAALEASFEQASGGMLARPFLSFSPYALRPAANEPERSWRPILLLNATHEESGNRIITGHVLIERNVFIDSLDALNELGADVRISTAAHNSARFTYVSPAGDLGHGKGSVIDGGYFENYGALSALEIARAAREELEKRKHDVKLAILMISSDPGLEASHTLVRINEVKDGRKCLVSVAEREPPPAAAARRQKGDAAGPNYFSVDPGEVWNALLNEFVAPFQGLEKVREAHGNRAAAELAAEVCAEFADATKTAAERAQDVTLSPQTRVAATLDVSKDVNVNETKPVEAKPENPYFAHMEMCERGTGDAKPVQPPLGWVLSQATRDDFPALLNTCDNDVELGQLEKTLGLASAQQSARQ